MLKTLLFISIVHFASFLHAEAPLISSRENSYILLPNGDELSISPNPASDNLIVNIRANTELYIFNVLGNKIATIRAETSETIISVSNYPNGVYLLKTSDGQSGRFVVKH